MQVDTGFLLLNIFTVDTSQHLCHHNLLSKVLLIYDHLVVVFILCQAKELNQSTVAKVNNMVPAIWVG